MKPISEYNFREIIGHFVIIESDIINPDYNKFIGYCYIDTEAGMSIKIYGALVNNIINKFENEMTILRCSEKFYVEVWDNITEDMQRFAESIEHIYTPKWISVIRDDIQYDPYRDVIYPDDLLIPVRDIVDGEGYEELLWVRPIEILNDKLYGITIENGKWIKSNTIVVIFNASEYIENRDIIGATINCFKEEDNEI